jgi:hypothetical protein
MNCRMVTRSLTGCPPTPVRTAQGMGHHGIEDPSPQRLVHPAPDAADDALADVIKRCIEGIEHGQQHGQGNQRGYAVAGQHAIVDLEHEERPGQHQNVDDQAEDGRGNEGHPAGRYRRLHLRRGPGVGSEHEWTKSSNRNCWAAARLLLSAGGSRGLNLSIDYFVLLSLNSYTKLTAIARSFNRALKLRFRGCFPASPRFRRNGWRH